MFQVFSMRKSKVLSRISPTAFHQKRIMPEILLKLIFDIKNYPSIINSEIYLYFGVSTKWYYLSKTFITFALRNARCFFYFFSTTLLKTPVALTDILPYLKQNMAISCKEQIFLVMTNRYSFRPQAENFKIISYLYFSPTSKFTVTRNTVRKYRINNVHRI